MTPSDIDTKCYSDVKRFPASSVACFLNSECLQNALINPPGENDETQTFLLVDKLASDVHTRSLMWLGLRSCDVGGL